MESQRLIAHIAESHWTTPQKNELKGIEKYRAFDQRGHQNERRVSQRQLFRANNIPLTSGRRILKLSDPRRLENSKTSKETRGRKPKLSDSDLHYVEILLWRDGYNGRALTWDDLVLEANLEKSGYILYRHLKQLDCQRCIACERSWVSPKSAAQRGEFAKEMLAKYPRSDDWYNRQVHFGYADEGEVWVTRKPGERACPACVVQKDMPKDKDLKRVHAWGAVGYNYKSKLYRYDVGNSNGKMTQSNYLEFLEEETASWPSHWALEEDGDSGHGKSKSNPIRTWKAQRGLKYYFNRVASPDLAPIENVWQAPKQALKKHAHWDDTTTWEVALQGVGGHETEKGQRASGFYARQTARSYGI
ncbi:hypothetical protein LTS17_012293 [Exophiala oligosperma]